MVEKWCRMKCRLTDWHLEPILIIISIPGFEDFISYPRCRSLAGFWIVDTISNSFPARTPDPVISNDSVVRASCQHPVRHLHYQEVQHLHYLPEHLLFPQVPSAYHPVPHVQSMAPHVPTFTFMYHWWFYLLFCTFSEKSFPFQSVSTCMYTYRAPPPVSSVAGAQITGHHVKASTAASGNESKDFASRGNKSG